MRAQTSAQDPRTTPARHMLQLLGDRHTHVPSQLTAQATTQRLPPPHHTHRLSPLSRLTVSASSCRRVGLPPTLGAPGYTPAGSWSVQYSVCRQHTHAAHVAHSTHQVKENQATCEGMLFRMC